MSNELDHIQDLIDSGSEANIKLAFSLIEATGIEPELPTESDLQAYFASNISGGNDALRMVETFYAGGYKDPQKRIYLCRQMLLNLTYWQDLGIKLGPAGVLPSYIRWMKSLTELRISVHSIPADFLDLPDWLPQLKKLNSLAFVGDFYFAKDAYQKLLPIKTLNFRENQRISTFPDTDITLLNLENLYLFFTDIDELNLDLLPNLTTIIGNRSSIGSVRATLASVLEKPAIQSIIQQINSQS